MSRGAEVIVAGAGALGLSCALALADAGCRVSVCDPAPQGPNASSVAAGMLAPAFETVLDAERPQDFDLLMSARNLWPGLARRAGVAVGATGAVAVGAEAWLKEVAVKLEGIDVGAVELDRTSLETYAPGLAPDLVQGLMVRDDWRLDAGQALGALRMAANEAGVRFRAEPVSQAGNADWLVVATGAGRQLARAAPELARLTPIKGQILRFADVVGGGACVRTEGAYAVPGVSGLALGATMEAGKDDAEVDPAAFASLLQAGVRLYPALAGAAFTAQAGVRAATPDGLPMAGFSRTRKLLLAVGARRNGWLLAPLVAQTIAACVTGRDPGPYAARLDPSRFGDTV